jgi:hypothetical protein
MKRNIKFLIVLWLFIQSTLIFSQKLVVKGIIKTQDNIAIPYCNISLRSNDKTFIEGTYSNKDGYYSFDNLEATTYHLKITAIGYNDYHQQINLDKQTRTLDIVLPSKIENIDEVQISAKKPTVIQESDRLIFKVANSILSERNTWEILKNTPTVFIDQDQVSLRGEKTAIYVNNKKIQLKESELKSYLEGLSGDIIESIEVMDNPPAKYDASSNSIINIVLKKKTTLGYKGSVNSAIKQRTYASYNFGTNHFYTTKKWDLFLNYSYAPEKFIITMDEYINYYNNENQIDSKWNSFYTLTYQQESHNAIFNADYKINKDNKLVLSTSNYFQPENTITTLSNGEISNNESIITQKYNAKSLTATNSKNLFYALDYIKDFHKKGENLTLGIAYNYYDNINNQNINTIYLDKDDVFIDENKFKVNSNQIVNIYTSQLDYTLPLKDKFKFETGAKISQITTLNNNNHLNYYDNNYVIDDTKTDEFDYNELNYSLYTSLSKKWKKWRGQIGLRGEYTKTEGNSKKLAIISKDDYFKVFPSLYLSYTPSKKHTFLVNYGKRIERPKYRQLNPFQSYYSDFTVSIGNPKLLPAIKHKLDFVYMYNRKHRLSLFYEYQLDKPEEISHQNTDSNILEFAVINLSRKINTGVNYYSNIAITKRWSLVSNIVIYYKLNEFKSIDDPNILVTEDLWRQVYIFTNNFKLLKDKSLNASINYTYASPSVKGSYVKGVRKFVYIDISKKIWKKKAMLSLRIGDVFDTQYISFKSKHLNQDNGFYQKNESQYVKIGFIYNFGNRKLKENKKIKNSSEKKRIDE